MVEISAPGGGYVTYDVSREDGATRVTLTGELDLAISDELGSQLEGVVESTKDRLVVDARDLAFADSSAIALWVKWKGEVPEIEIRDPPPVIRRVIETMGLDQVLGLS
jgi:anti-anti-sigma factor